MIPDDMPREHAGWIGLFTRHQMADAIPNGTRIVKVVQLSGDYHPVGSKGTVLGSLGHPAVGTGYFIEWDDMPWHAVFVVARKIALVM